MTRFLFVYFLKKLSSSCWEVNCKMALCKKLIMMLINILKMCEEFNAKNICNISYNILQNFFRVVAHKI